MYKLPVGIIKNGKVLDEVELNQPTGRSLKNIRNAMTMKSRGFNPKVYKVVLRDGVRSIKGIPGAPSEEDLMSLTWADAEYIFMELARLDLDGDSPKLAITCPSCGKESRIEFAMSDVTVERLSDKDSKSLFSDSGNHLIPFKLSKPISLDMEGKEKITKGKLRLLTVGEMLGLYSSGVDNIGTAMLDSVYLAIDSLGDHGREDFSQAEIELLPAKDLKMLERLYNENLPGVHPPSTCTCPSCGAEIPMGSIDWVTDFLASSLV